MKKKSSNIKIEIRDQEKIYNDFDRSKLSDELGRYIYNQRSLYNINQKVGIDILLFDDISTYEELELQRMIHKYFKNKVKEMTQIEKQDTIKKILLFLIGTIIIFLSHNIHFKNDFIVTEILLIIGWVAIWEVFDIVLFRETKRKFKLNIYKKLSTCKINIDSNVITK